MSVGKNTEGNVKTMKILITSGSTKIKIDRVRSITNMSKGTFGGRIAQSFADRWLGNEVTFLAAVGSKLPYTLPCGCFSHVENRGDYLIKHPTNDVFKPIRVVPYVTFDDYQRELDRLLADVQFDIVVLAAAVSDYGVVNYMDGKIRSKDNLTIELQPLPKLIGGVRQKAPSATIVGFKLLVDSKDEELREACVDSIISNQLDMVVGNDLRDLRAGDHRLTLCFYDDRGDIDFNVFKKSDYDKGLILCNLPDTLVSQIMRMSNNKRRKTNCLSMEEHECIWSCQTGRRARLKDC